MLDHRKREQPGVGFENPSGSGRAWVLAQAKGPYILKPGMVLERVCCNRQQLHHGLFDRITVSPFHHIGYFGFRIISHWISRSFFFELGALHWQWCCGGSITRSLEQAIITLVDKISYGTTISGFPLPCRRIFGGKRHQYANRAPIDSGMTRRRMAV